MSIFSRLFRIRDKPSASNLDTSFSFLFGGTTSGKIVNERTAMQVTAVYACVRLLSESLAGLPIHIYRNNKDGSRERVTDHPLYPLLHDAPNEEMSSIVFKETLMSHLLLYGNSFAQIIRNGRGQVLALYPLLPDRMDVNRTEKGALAYTYQMSAGDKRFHTSGNTVTLRRDEVLHIPGLSFDGLVGYSPIALAKNAIGMALATEEYGASFFANGATPGGVLEHPGTIADIQRVKDSWNASYKGSKNAHRLAILEEGMKYHQIGIPPEQAQFLESRKFQLNEIARIFRVPPHMIGDLDRSSFNNIEQQSLEFVKYTLNPWVIRWEQALKQALVPPSEKSTLDIKMNVDGLLRGDYGKRMAGYATARQNGWLSANEIRALEEMNRIPAEEGGDLYLVNGNMCSLLFANEKRGTATGSGVDARQTDDHDTSQPSTGSAPIAP